MLTDETGIIARQIEPWIRKQVVLVERDHGRPNKIVLRHLSVDRKVQGDVGSFPVKYDPGTDDVEPLINRICEAAQRDADDLGTGIQSYALFAYFPEDSHYVPRKIFRVAGSNEEFERDLSPSEPANEKGMIAQLMRHNEAIMRTMTVSQGYITSTLQRENQRISEMNEKFMQQQVDMMLLIQDTIDNSHSRRLTEKKEEASLAMKEGIIAKLDSLVPVIVNRISGKQLMPVPDPAFMLMGSLLENMSDEQQVALVNMLKPEQRPIFGEMLAEYEKKKAEVAGTKPNLLKETIGAKSQLPPSSDVESDLLVPVDPSQQLPMFQTIQDRINQAPSILSNDPAINAMENRAKNFANRFADVLSPKKKDP